MENKEDQLEMHERVKGLEVSVDEIKNNHLVHLKQAIERVDERTWQILVSIIISTLLVIGVAVIFK